MRCESCEMYQQEAVATKVMPMGHPRWGWAMWPHRAAPSMGAINVLHVVKHKSSVGSQKVVKSD